MQIPKSHPHYSGFAGPGKAWECVFWRRTPCDFDAEVVQITLCNDLHPLIRGCVTVSKSLNLSTLLLKWIIPWMSQFHRNVQFRWRIGKHAGKVWAKCGVILDDMLCRCHTVLQLGVRAHHSSLRSHSLPTHKQGWHSLCLPPSTLTRPHQCPEHLDDTISCLQSHGEEDSLTV